jgi:hypothetical protein
MPDLVRIEERDEITTGLANRSIAGGRDPLLRLLEVEDFAPIAAQSVAGVIGRTVVDHDDLTRRIRLGERAADRVDDIGHPVVRGDHHANCI